MYGRVTKYFQDRGYGFIRGEDNNSYFVHCSKLYGEQIERGYYVSFEPYQDERSDYNAKEVHVIEVPENMNKPKDSTNSKKKHKKHKSCNADKVIKDDKSFNRFVRNFMKKQTSNDKDNYRKYTNSCKEIVNG